MIIKENSYDPHAEVEGLTKSHLKEGSALLDMAYVCAINSTATIVKENGIYKRQGEPTEAALIVAAEKIGKVHSNTDLDKSVTPFLDLVTKKINKIGVLEFSSDRKTMSTII